MDDHSTKGRFQTGTLLCANDRFAVGALRAANRHRLFGSNGGLRIAGHDDHPLSRFMTPIFDWTCLGKMPGSVLFHAALFSKATGLVPARAECLRRGL